MQINRISALNHLVALAAVCVAVALRWMLDPWLGPALPFVTLFGAVAIAVWYGGYGAGITAAIVGGLACSLSLHRAVGRRSTARSRRRRRPRRVSRILLRHHWLRRCTSSRPTAGASGTRVPSNHVREHRRRGHCDRRPRAHHVSESARRTAYRLESGHRARKAAAEVFQIIDEATRQPVDGPVEKVMRTRRSRRTREPHRA